MKYVHLGNTGLNCSVISFGGIPIQRSDAANTQTVIDRMEHHGINFIDTARGYTVSEEYLGAALQGRRSKFVIATKSMSRTYQQITDDVDTSLRNLRTDHIELYQLHNIPSNAVDQIFSDAGAYQALQDAKKAGKIGHIGATTHSLDALKLLTEEYSAYVETLMFPYNIIETQGHEVLASARKKGIGTIAMKPLAGGNLDNWSLALRFIAASQVCDISIPGMGSPEEVDLNASVADTLSPLTAAELDECEKIRSELGNHFCRRCGYCAPCTAGIDIPSALLMANYLRRYGLADWAKSRYAGLSRHASDCVQCRLCEFRCPYHLPIREMLSQVVSDFGF